MEWPATGAASCGLAGIGSGGGTLGTSWRRGEGLDLPPEVLDLFHELSKPRLEFVRGGCSPPRLRGGERPEVGHQARACWRSSLSPNAGMPVPLPKSKLTTNWASLRPSCHEGRVKSGMVVRLSLISLPLPSAPWHFTQYFRKSTPPPPMPESPARSRGRPPPCRRRRGQAPARPRRPAPPPGRPARRATICPTPPPTRACPSSGASSFPCPRGSSGLTRHFSERPASGSGWNRGSSGASRGSTRRGRHRRGTSGTRPERPERAWWEEAGLLGGPVTGCFRPRRPNTGAEDGQTCQSGDRHSHDGHDHENCPHLRARCNQVGLWVKSRQRLAEIRNGSSGNRAGNFQSFGFGNDSLQTGPSAPRKSRCRDILSELLHRK